MKKVSLFISILPLIVSACAGSELKSQSGSKSIATNWDERTSRLPANIEVDTIKVGEVGKYARFGKESSEMDIEIFCGRSEGRQGIIVSPGSSVTIASPCSYGNSGNCYNDTLKFFKIQCSAQ